MFNQGYGFGNSMTPMAQMQQMMQQQQQVSLVKVTGIEGARAYQMPPNSSIALFDSAQDVMYVKTTDGAGFPTIRTFAFTPIETSAPQQDFVTREEFMSFQGKMMEMISNGKQPVPAEPVQQS